MKKLTLLTLIPIIISLGACRRGHSSSSASTSSQESSSSEISSSEESSSSSSSSHEAADFHEVIKRVAYAASKYNKDINAESLADEAGIEETDTLSMAQLFHLIHVAFDRYMPEVMGARRYQGDFSSHETSRTLSSQEQEDYNFLQQYGLIAEDYNPDETVSLSIALQYLNRIHAYIGTSLVDDFAYTTNHDWLYDNDSLEGLTADDDRRDTNLVSQSAIGENAFELLKEASQTEAYSNLSYLVDAYENETVFTGVNYEVVQNGIANYYGADTISELFALQKADFLDTYNSPLMSFDFDIMNAGYNKTFDSYVFTKGFKLDRSGYLSYLLDSSACNYAVFVTDYGEKLDEYFTTLKTDFALTETMVNEVKNSLLEFFQELANYARTYYKDGWSEKDMITTFDSTNDPLYKTTAGIYSLFDMITEAGVVQKVNSFRTMDYYVYNHIGNCLTNESNLSKIKAFFLFNYLSIYEGIITSLNKHNKYTYVRMAGYNLLSYYQTTEKYTYSVSETTDLFNNLITALKENATTNGWLTADGVTALSEKANKVKHCLYGEYDGNNLRYEKYISNDFTSDIIYDYLLYKKNLATLSTAWMNLTYEGEMTYHQQVQTFMEPFVANAFYYPLSNSIYITMGYLFSKGDDFANYDTEKLLGTFGLVMGHEITHGFDSNGCYYDGDGNRVASSIFPTADLTSFKGKQQDVIDLYNYEVMPGIYQSGKITLSEDLADIGGLGLCLNIASKEDDFDYSSFYIQLAQNFMSKSTRTTYLRDLATDVHAYGGARLNPLMMSRNKFAETFNVQELDGMYRDPSKEIIIW